MSRHSPLQKKKTKQREHINRKRVWNKARKRASRQGHNGKPEAKVDGGGGGGPAKRSS